MDNVIEKLFKKNKTYKKIDPFDIVSGKVVQNRFGTFWFKEAGNNLERNGWPIVDNLHRENGPAIIWPNGVEWWCVNGEYKLSSRVLLKYYYQKIKNSIHF